jgi:2'-5' RNA ligase
MDLRLFTAIELDHAGKRAIGKLIEKLGRQGGQPPGKVRFVTPEQMHLTLNFLGQVPAERVPEIAAAMGRAVAGFGPIPFTLSIFGGFPDLRQPRVLWVGVAEPTGTIVKLQRRLTEELAALGFASEQREYHPHITVGRSKSLIRRLNYEEFFAPHRHFAGPEQLAQAVVLFSSELGGNGSVYTRVATAELKGL